jgi:2-oxo-hept-3-ene-1,7-dioate hydratase
MLDDATIAALAAELHDAQRGASRCATSRSAIPAMTIDDGYAIQRAWLQLGSPRAASSRAARSASPRGRCSSSSQITEPDYAPLLDDMFFEAGGDIPIDRFIAPRVEVELAFILGRPLQGPGVTLADVLAATELVTPAVEIIDARIEQFDRETKAPRKVFDTIADFAANAGIVTGGRPVRPHDVDLRWVGAMLYKNGVIEETGLAAAVLNHPGNGVAWLANKIAPYDEQLNAGDVVLGGSFTRPTPAARGDVFHVDYGPLGAIAFRFA